ncbi:type II secretion system protein [Anatilimnocola floriformis]|uniref:type II secretion system protein n=1 Tax=Anatilimnocola floriformis TaxID=2948575 RepID=UPI0021BC78A0|nr:type II secretion system protein [Anatilimnocola floriformis]
MDLNPYESPTDTDAPPPGSFIPGLLVELLVAFAIVGVFFALLLPAVGAARHAALERTWQVPSKIDFAPPGDFSGTLPPNRP